MTTTSPNAAALHNAASDDTPHTPDQPINLGTRGAEEARLEAWILLYLFGGVLVFTSTVIRTFSIAPDNISPIPAMIGSILLGVGLLANAFREIRSARPAISTLAALAVVAAITQELYEPAGYVAFILLIANQALTRTAWGARRAIEELASLTPDTARLVAQDGSDTEVPLAQIKVGDTVRVRPGENLPVDGTVTAGASSINQASLTGEALPVEVQAGTPVFAGTTNLTAQIELKTTSVGEDTTIGKVAELINEAESSRTPRQELAEQVARYFLIVAFATAGLVWYFTQDPERAIAVLIVVCPASLVLASPTAMMAAFAAAARLGIMIKQTSYLEAAINIDTFVFDKTGTITTGRFAVSRLAPAQDIPGAELLQAAADAEQASNHPLARSIIDTATQANINPANNTNVEEIHGAGVKASFHDEHNHHHEIFAGRPSWIAQEHPHFKDAIDHVESQIEGMSGVHVLKDGRYLGAVGLEDKLRFNAKGVVAKLRDLGARSVYLMTGDRLAVAKRVGRTVAVDRIEAECLPEEKHRIVEDMVKSGRHVLVVGDGINDGPSLAAADVGVAMGLSGSDIATNSAGVALMTDDISRVPFLVMLARRTRGVITQNIAFSILIALAGLILAASGTIQIFWALGFYVAALIFVLANSARLVRFGEEFTQQENFAANQQRTAKDRLTPKRAGSVALNQPAPTT